MKTFRKNSMVTASVISFMIVALGLTGLGVALAATTPSLEQRQPSVFLPVHIQTHRQEPLSVEMLDLPQDRQLLRQAYILTTESPLHMRRQVQTRAMPYLI